METATALAARGHRVTILTSGAAPGRTTTGGVMILRWRRLFADTTRHERWFGWRVATHLATTRYDVVHALMPWDAFAAVRTARLAGHRTVYEDLGIPIRAWWADKPDRTAREAVARRVDVYGCMSHYALNILKRDFGRSGVLIPGGVRMSEFRPAPEREPRPTVLFSGTLEDPRKGVGLLLEAVAAVATRVPDVQLWLSGPGDAGPLLESGPPEARARTTVLEIGEPHSQAWRYGRAWATALPSVNESFGMVLVESLACGTPIVVTDDSAPPELVSEGVGFVCHPGDIQSLAAGLVSALTLATEPGLAERCRAIAAEYDWDAAIVPILDAIYEGEPVARA